MDIRRLVRVATIGALFGALLAGLPGAAAYGQRSANEKQVVNIFLPAPRELALRLSHAKKAIENEEYAEAVTQLGRLLLELEELPAVDQAGAEQPQDYFIGPRGDEGTHTSLKTEAQRLIGSMPAKGREWYELQFGAAARAMLDEGVNEGDPAKLTAVSRRFFHTKAGYEATMLLGRHYMDRGQPLAAALAFKRVADAPSAEDFEPELSLLLSTCWLHANMPEKAQQSLAELQKRRPNTKWRFGAEPVELPRDQGQGLAWFEKLVGLARRSGVADTFQWLLFRGNATRNATTLGDMPLSKARWRVPTVNDPNEEKLVEQVEKRWNAAGTPSLPIFQPLAVNDIILMRTPDVLIGVDFKTGKRIWPFPWDELEVAPSGSPAAAQGMRFPGVSGGTPGASQRENELRQRIWEDAPYGQCSSDGEAVYLIHGLRFAAQNMMQIMIGPNGRPVGGRGSMTSNKLVALDLKREGSYRWVIGDDQGQGGDEPKLAGAFFLGAPLPLQGQLFVLAEINAEIRLVVLNARTGRLEWQQQLAHLESRTIQMDVQRRLAGASPSYADGVLVCPTSAGAVVAVDVATRTLLWGYQYNQGANDPRQPGGIFGRGMPNQVRPYGNRWNDATVTIHDGRVIMTPVEGDDLYCLDLLTGKLAWPAKKREEMLYVAGVFDGNIVTVGKRHVHAFKLADGQPAWPGPIELPEGANPSGRGIQTKGFYFLPTSASQLVKIDVAAGKIAETIRTERVLGNLISFRDEIVSQAADGLSVYHMVAPLRSKVSTALQKNADDGWALARLGELQLYDGKRLESLDTLRRALQLDPRDQSLRELLIGTLFTVLREDFAKNRHLVAEVERLIDQPTQRAELLRLTAEGMKKAGENDAAFVAFLNLAGVQRTLSVGANAVPPLETMSRGYSVRRDRWLQANLAELYGAASAEQRTKMDEAIEQLRLQSLESPDVATGRHFLRYFAFHPSADRFRLELAGRLIDADALLEAELLLVSLEGHANRELAGAAVGETARLLLKARQMELASVYLARLDRDYGDVVLRTGQTGAQTAAAARQDPALAKESAGLAWPYGRQVVRESENRTLANVHYARALPMTLREAVGPVPPGLSVNFDIQPNSMLVVRDGFGREIVPVQLVRQDQRAANYGANGQHLHQVRARGHLLVMSVGADVVAVNSLRFAAKPDEPLRWRHDISPYSADPNRINRGYQTSSTTTPWGVSRTSVTLAGEDAPLQPMGPISAHGAFFQKYKELVAVDLLTGEVLWNRHDFPAGCELFGDDELLFVIPPKSTEATVLSTVDGRELGKRKVEPLEQRWATSGRRMLTWSQTGGSLGLKLVDVWSGKALYEAAHPIGSRGVQVGPDELATLAPDGAFQVISLVDGQKKLAAKVDPEANLNAITVQRSTDQYLLAAHVPPQGAANGASYIQIPSQTAGPLLSAKIYAFSRRTGMSLWPVPAVIENYSMPLDQPVEMPVLAFIRQVRLPGKSNTTTSVLCIDKRDGRILFSKDDVPIQANSYTISSDPVAKTVTVQVGVKLFTIELTNAEMPPEPPAQTGAASSQPNSPQPNTRGLIASIEDAFSEADGGRASLPGIAGRAAMPRVAPVARGVRIQRVAAPRPVPVEAEVEIEVAR